MDEYRPDWQELVSMQCPNHVKKCPLCQAFKSLCAVQVCAVSMHVFLIPVCLKFK